MQVRLDRIAGRLSRQTCNYRFDALGPGAWADSRLWCLVAVLACSRRREARALDEVFLVKQHQEKETQELEAQIEAVHRQVRGEPPREPVLHQKDSRA